MLICVHGHPHEHGNSKDGESTLSIHDTLDKGEKEGMAFWVILQVTEDVLDTHGRHIFDSLGHRGF